MIVSLKFHPWRCVHLGRWTRACPVRAGSGSRRVCGSGRILQSGARRVVLVNDLGLAAGRGLGERRDREGGIVAERHSLEARREVAKSAHVVEIFGL
jgi:hypothetical protein